MSGESNVVPLPGVDPVALLQQMVAAATGEVEIAESDLPVPPVGTSPRGTAFWYAALREYGPLNLTRMVILEQIVTAQSHLDEVETSWRADGSPTQAVGSMGQMVSDPRVQEMRQIRSQLAALLKQIDLDSGTGKRRPGRPTRAQRGGEWGRHS